MLKSSLSLAEQRAAYQHHIWTYQQRKKTTAKGLVSIHKWTKKIAEIDKITNQMTAISNAVSIFAGRSPRRIGKNTRALAKNNEISSDYKIIRLAKSLFYKYGLEHNIWAAHLAQFVGAYRKDEAFRYRKEFTASFKDKNNTNKQKWDMFLDHLNRLTLDAKDDFINKRKVIQ